MEIPGCDRRTIYGIVTGCAVCGFLLPGGLANGQAGKHMMVFEDDGGGPRFLHYSGPEMSEIRKPDFVRRDLPTFNEELQLDEMQRLVVATLLDVYLNAFKALADEALPTNAMPGMQMYMGGEGGEIGAGAGEDLGRIIRDAMDESGGLGEFDIEMEGGSGEVAIAVQAFVGHDGDMGTFEDGEGEFTQSIDIVAEPSGEEGEPHASVFISVGGSDDVELSPELREKLEEAARAMAEKIQAQMEQAEADGVAPLHDMTADEAFAEREKHFDDLRAAVRKLERNKVGLKQKFVTEVQGQLSPEQLGLWPNFERTLTRHKTLPKGRLDGERTDLVKVADALDLAPPDAEAVAEQLHAYEVALHQALLERNAFLREANSRLDKALQEGETHKALATVDQATRLRVAVRAANEAYTEAIAQQLAPDSAAAFRRDVLRASYPSVYRRTRANKAVGAILKLDGLDAETIETINELADAYNTELDLVNERIRSAIHRYQPRESREMVQRLQAMMNGGEAVFFDPDEDDPIRDAFKKRTKLDERYMKQFYTLLTPEQVAGLPKLTVLGAP